MELSIHLLTPDLLPTLESLFYTKGPVSRCWCTYRRIGSYYRKRPADENKADFMEIVRLGPPPGLLAFSGDMVVGWCQFTPRDALPWLEKSWRLKRVDDLPVWSLSCFNIRQGYRRKGVTAALIQAAIEETRWGGAPALDPYPLDAALTPSSSGTGYLSTFIRAGFMEVARHFPPRPIVRYEFLQSTSSYNG